LGAPGRPLNFTVRGHTEMPHPGSTKSTPVGLFEQGGPQCVSEVLLTPDAAKELRDALQFALATPEAQETASWPGEIIAFPVRPQFKGREQFVSFHIKAGKTPFTPREMIRRRTKDLLNVIFVCIGLFVFVRWLGGVIGWV
jgi:hypothetical protein